MRKPEKPDKARDALIVASICIMGVAFIAELRLIPPHNPVAAMFTVLGAALIATAVTLRFTRR